MPPLTPRLHVAYRILPPTLASPRSPAISASNSAFPGPGTPLPGLYRCGDSCAPGIGVPAAAASGMIAANTLTPVWSHWQLLDALGM